MKITIQPAIRSLERAAAQVSRHINALLFILFIVVMALAGFVFWRFGYAVSLKEPEVSVRSVVPKEDELRALIAKNEGKESLRGVILEKTIRDPFIQPEKAP